MAIMENYYYYKCKCDSDRFVRIYNVWNETIKVAISEEDVDVQELGKEKDHLVGYICADCRQDADELNEWL